MSFLSELLDAYGRPIERYEGDGAISASMQTAEVSYAAAQFADGQILLACEGGPEAFGVFLTGPTLFADAAANGTQLSTTGNIVETTMLRDPPADKVGGWAVFKLSLLHASFAPSGPPSSIRYLLTNYRFDTGHDTGTYTLTLPGVDAQVSLFPLHLYRDAELKLRALRECQPSAYLEISAAVINPTQTRNIVNRVCYLLSIARGTKIQWIQEELVNSAGERVHLTHANRVTKRFSTLAPIDPALIRGTKEFLEQTYATFCANSDNYRLESGTIDSVLDAKVEGDFLELRGAKLAIALELIKTNVVRSSAEEEFLLPEPAFAALVPKLSGGLKSLLSGLGIEPKTAERIASESGLLQLNRRSFSSLLRKIAKKIQLKISYENIQLFVRCRNSLVHRGDFYCATASAAERESTPPKDSKYEEYLFLVGFLDAFLLRLVGYSGRYLVRIDANGSEERQA